MEIYTPFAISDNQMPEVCDPEMALATYDTLVVRKIRAIWGDIYEALELVIGKNNLKYAFTQ